MVRPSSDQGTSHLLNWILFDVVARAQVSTVSLFPVGFMDDGLSGEAIGTGADGTTFVLSATFDELDIPYTS